jgi:Flp pilus assembly pilin Flp
MLNYLRVKLATLRNDERGVTVIEYALMVFLIAVAVTATLQPIRTEVIRIFNQVHAALLTV